MENSTPDPLVAPDAPQVPADSPAVEPTDMMDRIEQVAQEVVAEVEAVVHTIEHRCFGRARSDDPVIVTTHTGN